MRMTCSLGLASPQCRQFSQLQHLPGQAPQSWPGKTQEHRQGTGWGQGLRGASGFPSAKQTGLKLTDTEATLMWTGISFGLHLQCAQYGHLPPSFPDEGMGRLWPWPQLLYGTMYGSYRLGRSILELWTCWAWKDSVSDTG